MAEGMTMTRRFLSLQMYLLLLLATSLAVAAPSAKDNAKARQLGAAAKRLLAQGNKEAAAKKFMKADKLVPAPSHKLELAKILVDLEDFVQATEVLEACMDQTPIRKWAEKTAQKKCIVLASKVDDRLPRIAVVIIEPSSEDVAILIDGEDYEPSEGEVGFNPGTYQITAKAQGFDAFSKKVTVKEGDRKTIEVSLESDDNEDDDAGATGGADDGGSGLSPLPAYIAWGLGVAGVGIGIGFGVVAIQTTNEVLSVYECDKGECPPDAEDDLNVAKLNGNLSTVGFIIGGVGIAAGTVLYLLADTGDDEDDEDGDEDEAGMLKIEARPLLGPGYIGVVGTF